MLKPSIAILIVLAVTLLASQAIMGQISITHWISNEGRLELEGVGVYSDINCTTPVTYLDWGNLEPGSARNQTIFVRNEGSVPTTFFLATADWNPTNISQYIHLTWNYQSQTIYPHEAAQVTLTLTTSTTTEFQNYIKTNNTNHFDFITIIGINK